MKKYLAIFMSLMMVSSIAVGCGSGSGSSSNGSDTKTVTEAPAEDTSKKDESVKVESKAEEVAESQATVESQSSENEGFNSYDKNPSYDRTHDRSTEKREKQNPKTMEGEYKAQQYDHEKDISNNLQDERHKRPLTRQNHQEVFSSIKQGGTVNHKTFGSGTITYVEPPYIGVYFQSAGEKKFRYPDAFKNGYLEMC